VSRASIVNCQAVCRDKLRSGALYLLVFGLLYTDGQVPFRFDFLPTGILGSIFFRCVYFIFVGLRPPQDEILQTFFLECAIAVDWVCSVCFPFFRLATAASRNFRFSESTNRNNVLIFSFRPRMEKLHCGQIRVW